MPSAGAACQHLDRWESKRAAAPEQSASTQSFIRIYSHFPSLTYHLSSTSWQISGDIRLSQECKPYPELGPAGDLGFAPYKNPEPDDLRWSCGGLANAGEGVQIRLIVADGFDCTESIINQLLEDSKLY